MASKVEGAKCDECPLRSKPCAPTQGPKDSDVILVSRSPGFHEAMAGVPFAGPSGKVLDHLLGMNGVKRNDIRVTNVVLCAPDKGQVPKEAIKACAPRLAIELNSAKLVIACGSEAVGELIGSGSIDRFRGYEHNRENQRRIATNNPALVLRNDSTFPNLVKDFKRAFNPKPTPQYPEVELIRDPDKVTSYLNKLRANLNLYPTIACDIETRGRLHHRVELVSLQFSASGTKAVVLGEPGIRDTNAQRELRGILESDTRFVYHNGKFDVKALRASYGIKARLDEDTLLLSYALDERSGGDDMVGVHGLEYLLMEEFAWPKYETPDIKKFKKDGIVRDWDEFARYAGYDVAGTKQLFDLYSPQVQGDKDLKKAYENILIPGAEVTIDMELHGMVYDIVHASDMLENEVNPEISGLITTVREIAEKPLLNPASPDQMAAIFYDEWGIQHEMRKRPDKNRSVDDTARKEIIGGRYSLRDKSIALTVEQFVEKYARFQTITKQANTYLKGLIIIAEKDPDNRIFTELVMHGTNSGRLSSRKPNLQNITRPGRHEGIPNIRELFLPSPGRLFVQADYKQAELYVIACKSGDPELNKAFQEKLDLHNITAERFFGPDFTNENRQTSKNMNFGVAFRQSPETFLEKHGIPVETAKPYIKWWWEFFHGVYEWEEQIEVEIRSKGVITSEYGRKRRFYLLTAENIQASYREGINFIPQSHATDFTLSSAIRINREIDRERAALCLTVHDSILADVEEGYVDEYSTITKEIMVARPKEDLGWTLPIGVDIGVGPTWADAK